LYFIPSTIHGGALHTILTGGTMNVFFIVAFFLFGLVFGSFLNVCIYRMPRELSVVKPRSACPACGKPIAAYDNIPLLSWLILGGKCRQCKAAISPRYAAVELLSGAFFALGAVAASGCLPGTATCTSFPGPCGPVIEHLPEAIKFCVFSFLLLGLIFTDAETKLLPDLLTKPGIALGLLFSLFVPVRDFYITALEDWPRIVSLVNSLAGALAGSAFILGVALLYEALRGVEGMGRGDVKLMALIGAFLGLRHTLLVLVLGALAGSLFGVGLILVVWRKRLARRRKRNPGEPAAAARGRAWRSATLVYRHFQIPFGVFLGAAALFAALWGGPVETILGWCF
jgi:leader peptidase (prepilin peptidase) / N-methyltransferase